MGKAFPNIKNFGNMKQLFLQTSYSEKHQHLNSCVELEGFREWIKRSEPQYDGKEYEEIIGNLFWRGYLDVIDRNDGENLLKKELGYFCNKDLAHWVGYKDTKEMGRVVEKNNEFRTTQEGLLVGEVWSEINNKNLLLKYWNKYKYSLTLDIFWLLIFSGIVSVFFKDEFTNFIKTLKKTSIPVCCLNLGHNFLVVFLIFAFWPFLCWLYREIYLAIENR